jgi:hypothetical protein
VATFLLFAAASANRIKYLPLFAIAAAPLLVRQVFPALWDAAQRIAPRAGSARRDAAGAPRTRRVFALALAAWAVGSPFVLGGPALPTPHRELFEIARRLAEEPALSGPETVRVLNDANYGGWLELAFWLVRPRGASEPRFKPAMDNRTLVIRQERIREYDQLRQMAGDWRSILARWDVRAAIHPSRALMVPALLGGDWQTMWASEVWTVLIRVPNAAAHPEPEGRGE